MSNVVEVDEHVLVSNSSNLSQVWYDRQGKRLFVEFHNGSIAGYSQVPEGTWENFKTHIIRPDLSAGQYYNAVLRGKKDYPGINTDDIEFVHRPKVSKSRFTVTGNVRISLDLEAASLDEAIKAFITQYPDAVIKEATIKF